MKKMKKAILPLLCMTMLFCVVITAHAAEEISAGAENNASTWSISGISIDHRSLVFTVSDVDRAQDAVAVIQASSGGDPIEVPFSIRNTVDKISVSFPDGAWIPAGNYSVWITDQNGIESARHNLHVYNCGTFYSLSNVKAYPNRIMGRDYYNEIPHIYATVAFQRYEATVDKDGYFVIEYPTQPVGTVITLTGADDYGCTRTQQYTVEDKKINLPRMYIFRESIFLYSYDCLPSDERLCVETGGNIYYSDYGASAWSKDEKIITYPAVKDSDTITVWVESTFGSSSSKHKYSISDCDLSECNYYYDYSYPSKKSGTVKPDSYGHMPTTVSTTISGITYTAQIDPESGNYVLEYPRQKDNGDLILTFSDAHGCTYRLRSYIENTLQYTEAPYSGCVWPICLYSRELPSNSRMCVEINGKVYKSETTTEYGQCVMVAYPQQPSGSKLKVWYESDDSSYLGLGEYTVRRVPYLLKVTAKTTFIEGGILLQDSYKDEAKIPSVSIEISGRRYSCKVTAANESDKEKYSSSDEYYPYYKFQCSYPKAEIDKQVKVILSDSNGYSISQNATIKNTPPKLTVKKVTSSTTKVTGSTSAKYGSLVEVFTDKKTYKAKVRGDGTFSVKIKSQKPGTSIDVMVTTKDGNYNYKSLKIKQGKSSVTIRGTLYSSKSSVQVTLGSARKGDKLRLKVGSKTYTKKIKSGKKRQTITFPLSPKAAAGSTVKTVLYDKFGKKKGSDERRVYIGNTIYTGMSANDALLTTWGRPVRRNDWGNGYLQWVFVSGRTTLYVYIQNGRVVSLQKYNY